MRRSTRGDQLDQGRDQLDPPPATQVVRPWRATLRTAVAAAVGFIPIGTALAYQLGLDTVPAIAAAIGIGAAVSRVLSMPVTEKWLQTYAPWLAAQPPSRGRRRAADNPDGVRVADLLDPDVPNI